MASFLALSIANPNSAEAQSESTSAYCSAVESGSVEALERFIEDFPLSAEANLAFRDIVLLSRGSTLASGGADGLCGPDGAPAAPSEAGGAAALY